MTSAGPHLTSALVTIGVGLLMCRMGLKERRLRAEEAPGTGALVRPRPRHAAQLPTLRLRSGAASSPSRARATASMREWAPSARSRWRMWFRTVSMLRWSSRAIWWVEWPRSRRRSTSACRGVR